VFRFLFALTTREYTGQAEKSRPELWKGCNVTGGEDDMIQPKTAKAALFVLVVFSVGVAVRRFLTL
jgi:hypothetical protein